MRSKVSPLERSVHIAFDDGHVFQAAQAAVEFGEQGAAGGNIGGPDVGGVARTAHGGNPGAGADIQQGVARRLRQAVHEFARVVEDGRVDDVRRQGATGAIGSAAAVANREIATGRQNRRGGEDHTWRFGIAGQQVERLQRAQGFDRQHARQFFLAHEDAVPEEADERIHRLLQGLANQHAGRRTLVFREVVHVDSTADAVVTVAARFE